MSTATRPGELARGGQYLSFTLAAEQYAIAVLQVQELIQYVPVTRMPALPAAIRGVVSLRGRVVPVVDLAVRFGLPESTLTKWTCVVMVEVTLGGEQNVVGLLADAVNQVVELTDDQIAAPPLLGTRAHVDILAGVGKLDSALLQILRVDRLLEGVLLTREQAHASAAEAVAVGSTP